MLLAGVSEGEAVGKEAGSECQLGQGWTFGINSKWYEGPPTGQRRTEACPHLMLDLKAQPCENRLLVVKGRWREINVEATAKQSQETAYALRIKPSLLPGTCKTGPALNPPLHSTHTLASFPPSSYLDLRPFLVLRICPSGHLYVLFF